MIKCAICGFQGKSLDSHLVRKHGTTSKAYKMQFGLPTRSPEINAKVSQSAKRQWNDPKSRKVLMKGIQEHGQDVRVHKPGTCGTCNLYQYCVRFTGIQEIGNPVCEKWKPRTRGNTGEAISKIKQGLGTSQAERLSRSVRMKGMWSDPDFSDHVKRIVGSLTSKRFANPEERAKQSSRVVSFSLKNPDVLGLNGFGICGYYVKKDGSKVFTRSRWERELLSAFESLELKWEPVRKSLPYGNGWWIPDFYLPDLNTFVELHSFDMCVKDGKHYKVAFSNENGHHVLLITEKNWGAVLKSLENPKHTDIDTLNSLAMMENVCKG